MAGAGYGVTPMSRLSQQSSRRRHRSPLTGKPLVLSSPNISTTPTRKKIPKRKTLSSRYTAELPSKRRKLGRSNAISDPANLDGPVDLPHATEEERASNHLSTKVRVQKARAKAQIRASSKARTKANGVHGTFNPDVSKLLGRASDLKSKLLTVDENHRAGYFYKGNLNRDLSPEKLNLEARPQTTGTNEIADETDRQAQASNRGLGRKGSSKCFPNTSSDYITERYYEAAQPSGAASPSLLSESQAPGSMPEDSVDGSSLSRQDSHLLEGRFLRPRRQAKIKLKSDEVRLPSGEYVGKRVVVYWPHAKAWYAGKVISYDEPSKKHKIKYDDGDEECISFRRHKVVLESSLTQPADCPASANGVESAPASHHPVEEAVENAVVADGVFCKAVQLQRDFVEDNALLSAFAIRQRSRETSHELLCNGSAKPVVQKASRNIMSSIAQPNTARTGFEGKVDASGGCKGEAAFVYVRRTKGRQKLLASSPDLAPGGRVNDSDSLSGAHMQERPRKRKYQPRLQQSVQVDLPHVTSKDANLNEPAPVDVCDYNGGNGSASEHALRKRNMRPLKKLVSQVSMTQRIKAAQVWEPQHERKMEPRQDRKRKQRGRKPVRKHKLESLALNARNRGRPAKRVSDDAQGFVYSSLCYDTDEQHGYVGLVLECHNLFDGTIYVALPVVMPELFTWALSRILSRVNFCKDCSFDERFSSNGSLEDWKSVFRIVSEIVKAIPLSDWINGRQWQRRILHELWSVMPRCGSALIDTLVSLPPEADSAIVEHLGGAVLSCMMTSRQILNLFVCYFIKPYIVATLCERGASFKAIVEEVLLWKNGKDVGFNCLRQSMKVFPLQLEFGSADLDFGSYLIHFPRSTDWCTEQGLFSKQLEGNIGDAACTGCAVKWIPVSTIKKTNHLEGWRITSVHLVNHRCAIEEPKSRILRLEQGKATFGISNNWSIRCPRHAGERLSGFSQDDGQRAMDFHNCKCLNSALLFTSFLQRFLHEAAVKSFAPLGLCSSLSTKCLLLNKATMEGKQSNRFAGMELIGAKEEVELGSMVVPNSALQSIGAAMKHVKSEPEMMISRRNSSITTESNGAAIKEESSVEMYERHQSLSLVGQHNNGFPLKANQQHFSGQIDQEYYGHKRSKDTKKVKKNRLRHRVERRESVRQEPSMYCCADLLFDDGGVVVREPDVKVEVQPNGKVDFMVAVHLDGTEVFAKRIKQLCTLGKNPPELSWKSGNGWAIDFPDREQWEIFRGIYNELCIRIVEGASVKEIPVPVVKGIDNPDAVMVIDATTMSGPVSVRPYFAIRSPHDEIGEAFRTGRILYDLDSEDEAWMGEMNRVSSSDSNLAIPDYALEQIIDTLEKEAYKRGGQSISGKDAVEVCLGLGDADMLQAVHAYWCNKRRAKGMALLRYFQPPLWQQYQEKYDNWEARMDHPRPVMSAFCLQSRTLNISDRVLRQRSQRKVRPPSRSSSEDSHRHSHRLPTFNHTESVRLLTHQCVYVKPSTLPSSGLHLHGDRFHKQEEHEESEDVKAARETAVEARKLATKRTTKLQRRFLQFDLALQRAWALLIEYEAVAGVEALAQNEALEERMARLFRRCSTLLSRGDDSSENELPFHSGQGVEDVVENFARKCSLNVQVVVGKNGQVAVGVDGQVAMREDGQVVVGDGHMTVGEVRDMDFNFGGDAIVEEAYPLLPISVEASSYAWSGSSLL